MILKEYSTLGKYTRVKQRKGLSTQIIRNGKGICKFKDGRIFDGSWKNGYSDGNGLFLNIDGNIYDGQFIKGSALGTTKIYVQISLVLKRRTLRRRGVSMEKTRRRNHHL